MATWEDGPEYAPADRPSEYAVPDVHPLSVADPPQQQPAVPADRPRFGDPDQPVTPLGALVPGGDDVERDPRTPFDVDSDAMTQSAGRGAWGAAHWRPPTGAPSGFGPQPSVPAGHWGPPTGAPVAAPTEALTLHSAPAQAANGMPAPGTPAWFGPGPGAPQAQQPPPTLYKATPPGAIIVLAFSLIWPFAPILFVLAFLLSARARYARRRILTAFAVVGAVVLLIPTIVSLANYGDLTGWYSLLTIWALLGSLLMIVLILVLVNTELKNLRGGRGPGQGYPRQQFPPNNGYPDTRYPTPPHQQPPTRQ
jgi:hypothetical protein